MKAVGIVGESKAGKTSLVERLVPLLSPFGRVGTVKHTPHHEIDASGDTRRHRAAGAEVVAAVTATTLVRVEPRVGPPEQVLREALSEMARRGVDFALVEGFKQSPLPKIALGDVAVENVALRVDGEPDADAIAGFIRRMDEYRLEEKSVELKLVVDGKDIPVNDFVREFVTNTVAGAVRSLRGVEDDWEELDLRIRR